jgi:hypothetical protein
LHCPERVAQVLHVILSTKHLNSSPFFVLDLKDIQEGLDRVHEADPATVVNFDDINQSGATNQPDLRKRWHEAPGLSVVVDMLRLYYPIIFFKCWMLAVVGYFQVASFARPPTTSSIDYWDLVAHLDSGAFLVVEVALFVYSVVVQERGQDLAMRSWHRGAGVLLAVISWAWVWVNFDLGSNQQPS